MARDHVILKMVNPNRGTFHDRHPDHPHGEVWVRGEVQQRAAQTKKVLKALGQGYIEVVKKVPADTPVEDAPVRRNKFQVASEASIPGNVVKPEGAAGSASEEEQKPMTVKELRRLKRDDLDAYAVKHGVEDAADTDAYKTKDKVIERLEQLGVATE